MSSTSNEEVFNPWLAHDISEFSFFCCPECNYRAKSEEVFEHHAIGKHPLSVEFFASEVQDRDDINSLCGSIKEEPNDLPTESESITVEPFFERDETKLEGKDFVIPNESLIAACGDSKLNCQLDTEEETENSYTCEVCGAAFDNLPYYAVHMNSHDADRAENQWKCTLCESVVSSALNLRKHIKGIHLMTKVKCSKCDAMIPKNKVKVHMAYVHEADKLNKPFKCDSCDFSTHASKYLKSHIKIVHDKDKYKHECDMCDKRFPFASLLQEHQASVHNKQAKLMCHECGEGFQWQHFLDRHIESKSCGAKEPVTCEVCDDQFTSKRYYWQHFRSRHEGITPKKTSFVPREVMCEICSKAYASKHSLKAHMIYAHSANKPKKRPCKHCEKTFVTKIALIEHIKSKHENHTPFGCDECDKKFGTPKTLQSHYRTVHKRVKCDECNQEISNHFMLLRHKASVHNKLPSNVFQCQHCPQFYKVLVHFNNHMSKCHPEHSSNAELP